MRIKLVSVPVLDQSRALKFYTEILGFQKRHDIALGGDDRWLTVFSPEDPTGAEILLEPAPNNFEASKAYQDALFESGIPCCQFDVDDVNQDYKRLIDLGVEFTMKPTDIGSAVIAILNDTCGNLVQLVQVK